MRILRYCEFGETICNILAVFFILLWNVMELLSVREVLYWIYRVCSSKDCVYCACDPSVYLDAPSIGFVCVC